MTYRDTASLFWMIMINDTDEGNPVIRRMERNDLGEALDEIVWS
jgi:hypothetical protein